MFFQCGGSESRLDNEAGAEPSGQMKGEDLHLHAVVARSIFPSKNVKEHNKAVHVGTTLNSRDVEKVQAIAARSTCRSQNVQSTSFPEHFWKLIC